MNINIKATGFELTDAIRTYVHEKMQAPHKVLKDPESAYLYVEVARESDHHQKGEVFRAEVKIQSGGDVYFSVANSTDLYAAIDEVKDEIVEKIKGAKDKKISSIRRGGRRVKNFIKGFLRN